MPKVLIVDDEPHIMELGKLYLEREGFQVEGVGTGRDALTRQAASKPDLIILDLMLPDIDGFEVCKQIRAKSDVPILMLTVRKEDVDKIVGLELGADDYFTKPFNPRELVARVKAILRRYQVGPKADKTIEFGKLRIDLTRHEVTVAGQPVPLRTKEFALLAAFAKTPASCSVAINFWIWSGVLTTMAKPAPWMSTSTTCGKSWQAPASPSRPCAAPATR